MRVAPLTALAAAAAVLLPRTVLASAFVIYGAGPDDSSAVARIGYPVYGFYRGSDARVTGTVPATREAMAAAGKQYEPVVYEGAGHGFVRSGQSADAPAADRQARQQGWARWLALLADLSAAGPSPVDPSTWGQVKQEGGDKP
ncbi:MAG: dienelactone hydrolase family protein [Candidatus Latescibacterota bacterium]